MNRNVEVTQEGHPFAEGQLELKPSTLGRLYWPMNRRRQTITLYVPTDGNGVWVGGDPSVTKDTGAYLPPGQSFKLSAYYGPLWVVSDPPGIQSVFAIET